MSPTPFLLQLEPTIQPTHILARRIQRKSHLNDVHPNFHNLPYNRSEVILANHEDDGDDDRPKEHAVWILVGNLKSGKIPSHWTYIEPTDLPIRSVDSSCTISSALHPPHGRTPFVALSAVLLLEALAYLRTLSAFSVAAPCLPVRACILFIRHM